MNKNRLVLRLCVLAVLGSAGVAASALSLGKVRGDLLIGQRLDLSVPLTLDSPELPAANCFSIDLLHADTRIADAQINLSVEASNDPLAALLRIKSPVAVNEPVVTLAIKAACGAETTRRYTLLPDVAVPTLPVVEGTAPQPVASAAAAPASTPKATDSGRAATPPASAPATKKTPTSAPRKRPPAPPKVAAPTAKPSGPARTQPPPANVAASPAAPQAGRLKLDLIDAAPSAGRASAAAAVAVPAGLAAAAATLDKDVEVTRSLNEVIADEARLRALEAKIQSLVELNASNQAAVAAMKTRLEQAEGERYSNPLVYALGLALLLGGAAFVVQRRRQALDQRHWAGENTTFGLTNFPSSFLNAETGVSELPDQPDTAKTGPASRPPEPLAGPATPPPRATPASKAMPTPLAKVDMPDFFASSISSTLHSVSTEELFDIQRQADFFVVLGQHDKAIDLLLEHIEKNPDTSPLAYLDLLAIYHQQANRPLFDRLREDIQKSFQVQIPAFDQFTEQGRSLVDYPETLARITRAWPRPEVLALIEELVFSDPFQPQRDMFEVEAYRDLMLLFAVARGLLTGVVSEPLRQPGQPAAPSAVALDIDLSDQLKLLDNEPSKRPPA